MEVTTGLHRKEPIKSLKATRSSLPLSDYYTTFREGSGKVSYIIHYAGTINHDRLGNV